mmetsp:Transcript_98463/g.312398  ORF Transcript_98463/g.312398 Transcript_98463/m.312398 type:complete len:373 (+) Transcript_98463:197-1315(+)
MHVPAERELPRSEVRAHGVDPRPLRVEGAIRSAVAVANGLVLAPPLVEAAVCVVEHHWGAGALAHQLVEVGAVVSQEAVDADGQRRWLTRWPHAAAHGGLAVRVGVEERRHVGLLRQVPIVAGGLVVAARKEVDVTVIALGSLQLRRRELHAQEIQTGTPLVGNLCEHVKQRTRCRALCAAEPRRAQRRQARHGRGMAQVEEVLLLNLVRVMANTAGPPEWRRRSVRLSTASAGPPTGMSDVLQEARVELEDAHLAEPIAYLETLGHRLKVHEAHGVEGLRHLGEEAPRIGVPLGVGAEEDLVCVDVQEPVNAVSLGLLQSPLHRNRLPRLHVPDLSVQSHCLLVHLALPLVEARSLPCLRPPLVSAAHRAH